MARQVGLDPAGQRVIQGDVPQGDHRAPLAALVPVGRVQQPGIPDDQVAGPDRHVHLARRGLVGRMVGIAHGPQVVRVGLLDVPVEGMAVQVGPRDRPEAPVVPVGVDQVVHQEDLLRRGLIAAGIVPSPPVLVPEERRAAGRLADDEPRGPRGPVEPETGQGRQRRGIGHQFREEHVVEDADHAARGFLFFEMGRGLGVEQPVGNGPDPLQHIGPQYPLDHAETVSDQLVVLVLRRPYRHGLPPAPAFVHGAAAMTGSTRPGRPQYRSAAARDTGPGRSRARSRHTFVSINRTLLGSSFV